MKFVFLFWILFKTKLAKINKMIHPLRQELNFIKDKNLYDLSLNLQKKYEQDNIILGNVKIPFDYAYDSITIFKRNHVDCSCHRAFQAKLYTNKVKNSYIVHLFHYPLDKKQREDYIKNTLEVKNIFLKFLYRIANYFGILKAHISCVYEDKFWFSFDWGENYQAVNLSEAIKHIGDCYNMKIKYAFLQDINWKVKEVKKL